MKAVVRRKIEDIYAMVANEEDARICTDISEDACRVVPKNFFLIIISQSLTQLGDALSNPKTVLAWLMSYINAPVALIGFLVPIRESGSMLPQIVIASYVRRLPIRKWVWVVGSLMQCASIIGIGIVPLFLGGAPAGWWIIALLIVFSLSRGLSSVASKDVLGKTIPKTRRGRLSGVTATISGFLVVAAGLFLMVQSKASMGIFFYEHLIVFAGLMWIAGALVYANVAESPGATAGGDNALKEAFGRLGLLRADRPFRQFVIARSLLLCSALTAPFFVVLAQVHLGKGSMILGSFILANGIASSLSAPIWGKMADVSSKRVMSRSALITSLLGITTFIAVTWIPVLRQAAWFYPAAFFVLGIAHSGVRLGRKTYVVDMAGGNKRTNYVAVSNTIIGLILLLAGGVSALASLISAEGVILVLSLFGLAGAWMSHRLPEVSEGVA